MYYELEFLAFKTNVSSYYNLKTLKQAFVEIVNFKT